MADVEQHLLKRWLLSLINQNVVKDLFNAYNIPLFLQMLIGEQVTKLHSSTNTQKNVAKLFVTQVIAQVSLMKLRKYN
jgi:hypothetical protein